MNCPAMPPGGGRGMKFRKPFRPKTRKTTPARYRAIAEAVFITGFSFWIGSHSMASIILISIPLMMYTSWRFRFFMNRGFQGTDHVWLVMMKAMRALTRYAAAGIEETGLGLSDFGVLESPAAQRAFARQYDGPDRRSDSRLDQYRRGPTRG